MYRNGRSTLPLVLIADARPALGQVQLKATDVLGRSGVRRALQERREPLAGADVALLCGRGELARAHVLDHALAQRADGVGTHGELPSEVDNTSILRARRPITDALSIACRARRQAPAQRLSRQRFRALAHCCRSAMSARQTRSGAKPT